MLLRAICALVLLCIVVAGLWPFHAPRNEVIWLGQEDAVFFGRHGSIASARPLIADPKRADSSGSLQIWLEPTRVHSSATILGFYQPESRVSSFALRQSLGDLVLQRTTQNEAGQAKTVKIYIDDVLSHRKPVLVTISSNQSCTTVFVGGSVVRKLENFKLSSRDLVGRLVVGNSPATTHSWSGQLKGLALYDRELTADEVAQSFTDWTNSKHPDLTPSEGAVALYRFDERHGDVVHNQMDSATDLLIPECFFVLHKPFLERPWDEFRPDRNYWRDVGINVAGFVPLGFFFYAYFSSLRRIEHPVAITIALGFAVSLTIEVLQAYLPTRDSGMTDVITNTLGTSIGVMAFRHKVVQAVLAAAGLRIERRT